LEAANVEPVLTTARKTLMSDQLPNELFIFEEQHNVMRDTRGILVRDNFRPVGLFPRGHGNDADPLTDVVAESAGAT
jgi:hypothetical protein